MSRFRFLRLVPGLLAVFCFSQRLSAQGAVYGSIAVSAYGANSASTNTLYNKSDSIGFVVGGFYNFPIDSRLTAGVDLRVSASPGAKGGTSGAAAFRVGFVPQVVRLRPYLEIGGGVVSTSTNAELVNDGVKAGTYTTGALLIAGGLDVRATRSIDIRVLELGAEAGASSASAYLDAGVVFHFHRR